MSLRDGHTAAEAGTELTEEQLHEIGAAIEDDTHNEHSALCVSTCFWRDEARVLLAEVYRLRAERAAPNRG